jgi:protein-disulfide isomerase
MKKLMWTALLGAVGCGDLDERIEKLEQRVASLEQRSPTMKAAPKPVPLAIRDDDPTIGAKEAKVTIVEAFEYACPYCAMLDPIMDDVMSKYEGRPVKLVEKQLVVHPDIATLPALAVCAANRMGAYDRYAEALWDKSWKQEGRWTLDREALSEDSLVSLAMELGLDAERFQAELGGAVCKRKLEQDRIDLTRAGVRATPTLFINGTPYRGPRTVEALSAAIEQAMKG